MRRKWSHHDVENILSLYQKRVPIKLVARQYDSTPNAIQKVLQKFKRPGALDALKQVKSAPLKGEILPSTVCWGIFQPEWVDFEKVVAWLGECDYRVEKTMNPHLVQLFPWRANERYMTSYQVLLEANRRRLRRGRPIFWVEGISRDED